MLNILAVWLMFGLLAVLIGYILGWAKFGLRPLSYPKRRYELLAVLALIVGGPLAIYITVNSYLRQRG